MVQWLNFILGDQMKKALIVSYCALVAVVLLTPMPGKSEPQERIVLRSVDAGHGRIILSDGHVFRFRGALEDVHRDLRLRRLDRFQRLRAFDLRDRVIERNRLRGLRGLERLDRLDRLHDLRHDRLERLNELRLDRFERLNDLRLDRLDRLDNLGLERLERLNRLDRINRLGRLGRLGRIWRDNEF